MAIHASRGMTQSEYSDAVEFTRNIDPVLANCIPSPNELARGAVIGTMVIRDCVQKSASPWFQGRFGFVMDTPVACDPIPARGSLGFWEFDETPYWEE